MKKNKKIASINFSIQLDDNNIPENITWEATDNQNRKNDAKAVMISIWDGADKTSLKIDLWTKEMMAEEMNFFTFQIIDSLADSYRKSVGDDKIAQKIKDFAQSLGKEIHVLK